MYFFLKILECILNKLPRKVGYFLFEKFALLLLFFSKTRKKTLKKNLSIVLNKQNPPKNLLKEVYKNYARYYFDLFQSKDDLLDSIKYDYNSKRNYKIVSDLIAKNKGIIIFSLHIGNWDVGGAFLSQKLPNKVNVVVEKLSPGVFKWFKNTREKWGMKVIESTDIKTMLKVLKNGEILILLSDRDLEKKGYKMDFFNKKAFIPSGPAKLALKTMSPLIFGCMLRDTNNPTKFFPVFDDNPIFINKNLSPEEITQKMLEIMEKYIHKHPEQWCMLQKVWIEQFNK